MAFTSWNWTFKCYCRASNGAQGIDVINEWYKLQDEEVQAEMDAILEFLQNRPNTEWRRPKFDTLQGTKCQGLREIRISVKSGTYRVLAYFGPRKQEFTLLIGFHKKKQSDTDHACQTAQRRKQEVEHDETRARKCTFP